MNCNHFAVFYYRDICKLRVMSFNIHVINFKQFNLLNCQNTIKLNENIYFKTPRGFITTIIFVAGSCINYTAIPVTDLGGGCPCHVFPPPHTSNCSQCHAAFWKIWQLYLAPHPPPPGGSVPRPMGNPGSAPEFNIPIHC